MESGHKLNEILRQMGFDEMLWSEAVSLKNCWFVFFSMGFLIGLYVLDFQYVFLKDDYFVGCSKIKLLKADKDIRICRLIPAVLYFGLQAFRTSRDRFDC